LTQVMKNKDINYEKTQAIIYNDYIIDTPGEYIENPGLYRALIVSSADCDVIALLHDCTSEGSIFPPNFSSIFTKPVIGIITKSDLSKDEKDINIAKEILIRAGVQKIFKISAYNKIGIKEIIDYVKN
jgi:ethanolamine utilization protein EutP